MHYPRLSSAPALGTLTFLATANAYIWPSPQLDALESARWDQAGFNSPAVPVSELLIPCNEFIPGSSSSGRSDAADWIRTAYHDMATYNSTDGTGGLDASIRFTEEQARDENIGDGFANTMNIVPLLQSRYISMADSIALLAVTAIENCGGPQIAFRGGRLDAAQANAPGVPEPEQDLATHIASFARQGFTQTEMIGLVACGHTFGGVQQSFFPDIVPTEPTDPTDTENVAHFDTTYFTFDNNVATEYIAGTTQNPLVVGFNDTTNSDKRIFGSDGNVTMQSFANSAVVFASTCADLFARMLDTVPSGVTLSDVLTPLPVKPANVVLTMNGDVLQMTGQLRLWNTSSATVSMLWTDHAGSTGTANLSFAGTGSATVGKYTSAWYRFNGTTGVSLDATAGVTSLSFLVNGALEDQGGVGFAVQDAFMYSATSCEYATMPATGRIDVAVRNSANVTRVYLEQTATDSVGRISVTEIDITQPAVPVPANAAYSLWSINITNPGTLYNIGAEVDGVQYSTPEQHSVAQTANLKCPT
ncbi:Peroxidase [Mycena sanguinolenta]|uniref:Peroxidase n=1 Tax=Mycena sanguinolenta TaxID=230812 RepID=A0A8H7CXE1_9AGAR|nr:Peroxidase [Mycena sanguinolenta]